MKNIIASMLLVCLTACVTPANQSTAKLVKHEASQIILVRHAEKMLNQGRDPQLTEQGKKRAKNLASLLKNAQVSKIYSTNYQRTQMTAKPLAQLQGLEIEPYNPRELESFAEILKAQTGVVLVVGHSNTTPQLTALLLGKKIASIDESEYDHLFIVTLNANESPALLELSTAR